MELALAALITLSTVLAILLIHSNKRNRDLVKLLSGRIIRKDGMLIDKTCPSYFK